MSAGFESHDRPLKSARVALDEISHEQAPSQWLEERSADKKPAQQLGTLGGGNHFLEALLHITPPFDYHTATSAQLSQNNYTLH